MSFVLIAHVFLLALIAALILEIYSMELDKESKAQKVDVVGMLCEDYGEGGSKVCSTA